MVSSKVKQARTGVFIDGSNLFWAAKKDLGWQIDYKKLKEYLKKYYSPIFYNYYGCQDIKPSSDDFKRKAKGQEKFYNILEGLGYNVEKKPLKYLNNHDTKCDTDVEITVDIKNTLDDLNNIILFSGDSDFLKVIEDCHSRNKYIRIFSFKRTLAWELKTFAIKNPRCNYKLLDDLREELEFLPVR
jgi:uncharacterized LabA/DUF88 family protein